MQPRRHAPQVIERHFGFLEDEGFEVVEVSDGRYVSATYASPKVIVHVGWDPWEDYAVLRIGRRRELSPLDEPYWGSVELGDILDRRAPSERDWHMSANDLPSGEGADTVLDRGMRLVRAYADDLIHGTNLELIDELIASRPRLGVEGLDYAPERPWAESGEGLRFGTDSERPRSVETYLERSESPDPLERAAAALKVPAAMRGDDVPDEVIDRACRRLEDLLGDPDKDVRAAAASSAAMVSYLPSLTRIVELLDDEDGASASAFAAAATFLALDLTTEAKKDVLGHLHRFASKGQAASAQVEQLAWRLGERRGRRA